MNVLFLTHSFPRRTGDAAGSFILRLAIALRGEGIEVHVVAPAAPGLPASDVLDGITVERFRYAPRRFERLAYTGSMAQDVAASWSARLALVGFLGSDFVSAVRARRTFDPDVIHAHWWFPSGIIGTWLARLSRRPLITTLHGTDVRIARTVPVSRPLLRHVLRGSARVTAVSSWLAKQANALVPGVQPVVAPMPVAVERFNPGGARDSSRLLFVGRFTRQKGLDHLLRAVAQMERQATLDVVAEGKGRAEYEQMAVDLGIAKRVVWHGHLKSEQLARMYQSAAVVVVPSHEEGLGLVAAEAQLCEAPVVAFASGGLTDIVQHERTGYLVDRPDPAALAAAMDRVLGRPEEARAIGKAGRLAALSAFAPESAARQYANIYRSVVAS